MKASSNRTFFWLLFLLSALTAIAFFFIPGYIIQPFRHQNPTALHFAIALRHPSPWVTLAAAVTCLLCAISLWQGSRLWKKIGLSVIMLPVLFSAVMARLNYFEWMFHPIDSPQFQAEADSKLDKSEMILSVRFGNDARAYPISQMAYHHILNDVVESVPIAVTY